MPTSADEARAVGLSVEGVNLLVRLADGRVLHVAASKSTRLSRANPEQLARYRLIGRGRGIHWPDLDEDLSTQGLVRWAHRIDPVEERTVSSPGQVMSFELPVMPLRVIATAQARNTGELRTLAKGGIIFRNAGTPSHAATSTHEHESLLPRTG